jgi:hypothetical protein
VLYSPSHDIGFAHYPKTGGISVGTWFRSAFPDAVVPDPPEFTDVSHVAVRASLERFGLVAAPMPMFDNPACRILSRTARRLDTVGFLRRCPTRIIGVIRDPLEMLSSLYEFWRHYPFPAAPGQPFIVIARTRAFRDFVHAAVVDRMLLNYERFFDVDGPAWHTTRLVDFHHLDAGLAAVCKEFGIPAPAQLQRLNVGAHRDLAIDRYEAEAGPLMKDVRRYFRWYYDNAARVAVRGE